jgi:hypothetical protein
MIRRSFPVLAALSLLAACGDDPDGGALPVLRVGTGSGAPEGLANTSADAAMPGEKAMYVPANWEFVVRGELPALDTDAVAYVFPQGSEPTSDQLNSLLDAFDVDGSFTKTTTDPGTDYSWTTWSVGPNDGSGPSITVSDDGLLSWWYSEGWQEMAVGRPAPCPEIVPSDTIDSSGTTGSSTGSSSGSSGADAEIAAPEEPCEEWVEPSPPVNVPSASEAEAKFRDLFAKLGFGSDQLVIESYGDDWSAGAWAYVMVDGIRSSMALSASFGENGRLTYAGGYLGRPEALATYPRVGTSVGLDRLRADYAAMMGPAVGLPAIEDDTVVEPDVAVSDVPASDPVVDTLPVDSAPVDSVPVDTTPVDSVPVETIPDETIEPETITVEIVGVEEEYILYWSVDGEVYLVPGYTFVAAEDEWGYRGRYTVPAIPSEYLDIVQPPMVTEPMPIEPEPVEPGDVAIGIAPEEAETLVGLSEAEAVAAGEAQGWVVRVVARDGEEFPITMDYSTERVNLTVVDDVVIEVYVG